MAFSKYGSDIAQERRLELIEKAALAYQRGENPFGQQFVTDNRIDLHEVDWLCWQIGLLLFEMATKIRESGGI